MPKKEAQNDQKPKTQDQRPSILVTGAVGFIGSHLCERLVSEGHHVIGLDNFNDFYDPQIKKRNISGLLDNSSFTLVPGDILNTELLDAIFSGDFNKVRELSLDSEELPIDLAAPSTQRTSTWYLELLPKNLPNSIARPTTTFTISR